MESAAEIVAQYTSRDMIEAMIQNPRPTTFLWDLLVRGNIKTHDTEVVEIDIKKGGRRVPAYVSRVGDPNIVGKAASSTNIHCTPYLYDEIPFTAKDAKSRVTGQTVYQTGASARLDRRIGEWLAEIEDGFIRREELQIAEALQTGKLHVSGDDVDYLIDFLMDPGHLITNTGADIWGSGTEDKIQQLEDDAQLIRDKGAPTPTVLIMGVEAAREWLKDDEVLKYLDNRRVTGMGGINIEQLAEQEVTYLGTFSRIGLAIEIYSYQSVYTDPVTEQDQKYIATNKYVLTSTAADFRMHYGMLENLKSDDLEGTRFPMVGMDEKGRKGYVSNESAPMFGMHQPDAVVCREVKPAA